MKKSKSGASIESTYLAFKMRDADHGISHRWEWIMERKSWLE